jgi:hypothetical protein
MATKSSTMPMRRVSVAVSAPLQDFKGSDRPPATTAYAYSTGGALLGQAPLDAKGQAQMEITVAAAATGVRLIVGPASQDKAPAIEELMRRGAPEQHLRIDADQARVQAELQLAPEVWQLWLFGRCVVKGTLSKRVDRDGIFLDLPVCEATVEIYEVDPIHVIVPRIPKDLLDRLREVIVRPVPLPDPPPELGQRLPRPLPAPLPPVGEATAAMHAVAGNDSLRYAALAGSDQVLRQALVSNAALVRPLLCWLHPQLVTMQRVGTAHTDDCGHFRTSIFRSFLNPDQPDLYFKATQRLLGFFDVTIHAPTRVACHTWWDYACGTEVTLHTTHPLAITCAPCPPVVAGDNWVLFMAIGNFPLSRIHGTGQALGLPTPAQLGLTDGGAPWGGTLRPRLDFDNALRDALGVRHYRLSWKRNGEPDSAYKPLNAAISRHYAHMVGGELVLDAYALGPRTVGTQANLFEIPPGVPPLGQWSTADAVEDTASGRFDTVAADGSPLLDGRVQLRVELFDAAGAPVDTTALGIRWVVPTSTDLSGTIHTANAATLGLVSGNTMVITLHVNNEPCSAAIAPPTIGARAADPCCGVLGYAPGESVNLSWTAGQPHGFADYSFGVVRGVSSVFSASGPVGTGAFGATRTVSQLLNDNLPPGCAPGGCPVAGFSENLYVAARCTDGWSRQSQYDASAVRAFVLASLSS